MENKKCLKPPTRYAFSTLPKPYSSYNIHPYSHCPIIFTPFPIMSLKHLPMLDFRITIPPKTEPKQRLLGFNLHPLPTGKRLHSYGKSPFLIGRSTISMAIFNSYVSSPVQ